jgi:hypothetical protein
MHESATAAVERGREIGADADSFREVMRRSASEAGTSTYRAANLVGGALVLLVTLIVVLLAALVGGEFAAAIPSDSTFNDAITTTTDNAGTAFVIFGVTLLAIPATAAVTYIVRNMGPMVGGGGLTGRFGR